MSNLERDIADALRQAANTVDPAGDVSDVSRRVHRRHRSRTVAAAVAAIFLVGVTAAGLVVRQARTDRRPAAGRVAPTICHIPPVLPFTPTGLEPADWNIAPYQPDQGLAFWLRVQPKGVVEVWNGGRGELPEPSGSVETIEVVGHPATLGSISDGFSVVVQLGPTRCARWALVAHPAVTIDDFARSPPRSGRTSSRRYRRRHRPPRCRQPLAQRHRPLSPPRRLAPALRPPATCSGSSGSCSTRPATWPPVRGVVIVPTRPRRSLHGMRRLLRSDRHLVDPRNHDTLGAHLRSWCGWRYLLDVIVEHGSAAPLFASAGLGARTLPAGPLRRHRRNVRAVLSNRSIPSATVVPVLVYPDVRAAVAWLTAVFGFVEQVRIGDDHRSQMQIGDDGAVIVADAHGDQQPPRAGAVTHIIKVRVPDVHARFEQARSRGAAVVQAPTEYEYGECECTVEDLAGHRWQFTQTLRDVRPEEWGGQTVPG